MSFIDKYGLLINLQDSSRKSKAEPLPVKQQDYYDFNSSESDSPSENTTPQKGVLLPFKKNKKNDNSSKKDARSKKDKKKKKKNLEQDSELEKPKKKSKKKLDQDSDLVKTEISDKKETKKSKKEKKEKEKKEKKEKREREKKEKLEKQNQEKKKIELEQSRKDSIDKQLAEQKTLDSLKSQPTKVSIPLKDFSFTIDKQIAFDFKYIKTLGIDQTNYVKSIFKGHSLVPKSSIPIYRNTIQNDWVLIIVIFSLFCLSWLKVFHFKKISQYFNLFIKDRISSQILREEQPFSEKASILMFFSGLLTISLFFFQVFSRSQLSYFDVIEKGGYTFLKILLVVFVIFWLKVLSLKLAGHIFMMQKIATEYIFTVVLFFNILGIFLLPVAISLQYVPYDISAYFVYVGGLITLLFFLYGLYRGLIIGLINSSVSKFYLFIYLCTLEILPLLVVFKLLLDNLKSIFS